MIISGHNEHFSGRLKYRREEVGGDPMLLDFKVMNHEKKNARSGVSIQFRMLYCVYKVLNTTYFNIGRLLIATEYETYLKNPIKSKNSLEISAWLGSVCSV